MKLVIDIPEEEYKCVQITGHIGNATQVSNAIFTGTPFPTWIPVSARMPEEHKRVIVSDVFGVYIGEFIDAGESWGGKHFINEHGMHSKSVKAWMPLPEPYKEAEDEWT